MSVLSCLHFYYLCSNKFWQDMNLTKYERRPSREVRIGRVVIGGNRPIAVQSMTNTDTKDTEACVRQIERIFRAGGPIVRLTAQGCREGENLQRIVRRLREEGCDAAVVADIHFVPEVAAIAAKYVDKVRINPGNYNSSHGEFEALIDQCRERGVAIRIGVNHGSLSKRVFDEWGDTPEGMVASAMEFLRVCREKAFDQVVVSMKSSNTRVMVAAYRLLVEAMDAEDMHYPIHLGVTEAGTPSMGMVKSAMGIGGLLCMGIGDTIRVTLTADPVEEIYAAKKILRAAGLRKEGVNLIACPTCGRTRIDLIPMAEEVERRLANCKKNITVAVMGCVVNGPGEAHEADYGIAGGKDCGLLFRRGEILGKYPADKLADALVDLILSEK